MTTNSHKPDWRSNAASLKWTSHALINGRYQETDTRFAVRSPVDGEIIYEAAFCQPDIVDKAVDSARRAFEKSGWRDQSPYLRREALLRLADLIVENIRELALRDTMEMGKPISSALSDIRDFASAICRFYAEAADKIYGEVAPSDNLAFTLRVPRGVVAAIVPWNYPLPNATIKTFPALATGNCVVLKPSEISPGTALRLGELALEANIPEGVLNIIPGDGATTGSALICHPGVDMITFTGSTETAKRIMALSAQGGIRPLIMECGGKSPQIIFPDAPPSDLLAPHILAAAFTNQGQLCIAKSRLLVHQSRMEELKSALKTAASAFIVDDPLNPETTFGPVAGQHHYERVAGYISFARQEGANLLVGGLSDHYCGIQGTILDNVSQNMSVVQEEVFGPVLTIQSFTDVDEAIDLANGTQYGLAATAWTAHYPTAQAMIRKLKAGHVSINSTLDNKMGPGMTLASEPRGASGFGCETGLEGLKSYTAMKGIVLS